MGRPVGSKNKKPRAQQQMQCIRDAFLWVFHNRGDKQYTKEKASQTGAEMLLRWAQSNETEFYKLSSKLIPLEVTGAEGGPIQIITRAE